MSAERFVYKGHSIQGRTEFMPGPEPTHPERPDLVYASPYLPAAAFWLQPGRRNEDCKIGLDLNTGAVSIREQRPRGLEERFGGLSGSIYKFSADAFQALEGGWAGEVVSEHVCVPVEEIPVDDALEYLLVLERKGDVKILRFRAGHVG